MNLFSFFRKTEKTGLDSSVDSEELVKNSVGQTDREEVETELSFHPEWNMPQEQEYVFRFLSNELEPLKPNQISISGIDIDIEQSSGNWLVKSFIRSSLSKEITLGKFEIILVDRDDIILARKTFNLNELGTLPPSSARPWIFVFEKEYQSSEEPPSHDWKLAFNVDKLLPHSLDLDTGWEKSLSEKQKRALQDILNELPNLDEGEVNLTGFQSRFTEDGDLDISVFIRNGHTKNLKIEKVPLEIIDATDQVVCKGTFSLPPLTIKANSSKPWNFKFPKSTIRINNPDLSSWKVRVLQ